MLQFAKYLVVWLKKYLVAAADIYNQVETTYFGKLLERPCNNYWFLQVDFGVMLQIIMHKPIFIFMKCQLMWIPVEIRGNT